METKTNTPTSTENDRLVESLVGIGAEWAIFGLQCATSALERSARSMRLAARSLGTLARAIEPKVQRDDGGVVGTASDAVATEPDSAPTVTADPSKL